MAGYVHCLSRMRAEQAVALDHHSAIMHAPLLAVALGLCPPSLASLPDLSALRAEATIDVQHIRLDLRFDLAGRRVVGTATITAAPLERTDTLILDAGDLLITGISANDVALPYSYSGGAVDGGLRIALPTRHPVGKAITLTVDYSTSYVNESDPNNLGGSFGKGLRFFAPTTTEPRKRTQVWSMPEIGSNRYWFPCHDGLGDPRTVEVIARVPEPLTVVSNGELMEERTNSDGTRTFHWKTEEAHDNYQTFIVVGEYTRVDQRSGNTLLHSYGYPDEREATEASVERLPRMMTFFSELTGIPYPGRTFNQVVVQDFAWGRSVGTGMQSENMVDDHSTHADFLYLWDGIEAEGLAQQWCGMRIHLGEPGEAWISRGLARFLSERFSEHANGRDEMLLWNHGFNQNTYFGDWSNGVRRPISTHNYNNAIDVVQDNYAVNRASLVFHLLRDELGDAAFDTGLKTFMHDRWGKSASTDDVQRAMASAAGRPLGWFFDQWVRGLGHPVFEVITAFDAKQGSFRLTLRQTQRPDSTSTEPQTRWFQGHMDLVLDGDVHRVWLEAQEENSFHIPLVRAPQVLVIDHQSQWIKELIIERSTDEWIAQFTTSTDVMARQQASGELARIHGDSTTTPADKQRIIGAFHQVIRDRSSYWRVRYNAMAQLRWMITPPFDGTTIDVLKEAIDHERSWNRSIALTLLGLTGDPAHAGLYIGHLNDTSDRVVNAAAIALGKSKSPLAYDVLVKLKNKPSWKNQSLISALYGLRELGDERGVALALEALCDDPPGARWTLATPVWDYRLTAANTLVALNHAKDAWPILERRYAAALKENDVNDIFSNILLMVTLGDERTRALFPDLRERYKADANALNAVDAFEEQMNQALDK